ncbi:MAG: hypothetical protein U5M23_00265 [Marinagarivorans sp.]|nr:hypothetical protein [Marinagarivorans sp.]
MATATAAKTTKGKPAQAAVKAFAKRGRPRKALSPPSPPKPIYVAQKRLAYVTLSRREQRSWGFNRDGSIPRFDSLAPEVQRQAFEAFLKVTNKKLKTSSVVSQQQINAVTTWANEFSSDLELLPASSMLIRYGGIRQVVRESYKANGLEYHRARQGNLREEIASRLGYEPLPVTGKPLPAWPVAPALACLGLAFAAISGETSTVRPYLSLLGALALLKYRGILVVGIQPGKDDKQIAASAYAGRGGLGYFEK